MNIRGALVAGYLRRRARKRFAAIHIRGLEQIAPWERGGGAEHPLLAVVNHSSWWDAILPVIVSRGEHYHDGYGLMDRVQFDRYSFFRHVGILPIDRRNPRRALASLEEVADAMRGQRRTLWIFPQGKILPNDHRPIEVESGTAHLIRLLGKCSVAPVAFRYELGREELPIAYISVGRAEHLPAGDATPVRERSRLIATAMTDELNRLRDDLNEERTGGFELLLRGRSSINRRWDGVRGIDDGE